KKEFPALEWLANICSHIPNPREHAVRYYGQYSNAARGKRQKLEADSPVPKINEPLASKKEFRRNWARLIQKIYEVAPLLCRSDGA
ncbi:MAG: transposase, partial [Candidatus Ozemobacteraceae bacterium]